MANNTPNNNATPGPSTPRFTYHVPMNYMSGSQPYGGWAAAPTMSYSFAAPTTSASYMYNPYAAPPPPQVPVKKETLEQDIPPTSIPPPSAIQDPPPAFAPHWDSALRAFLEDVGMCETLNGLERDMLVMNSEWERTKVPPALKRLIENVKALVTPPPEEDVSSKPQDIPLEERKLDYVHPANGTTPLPPSTITKSISQFLAKNRARNDASNRAEFLLSLEEKRQRRGDAMDVDNEPSCARTDARQVDRTQQIKYDVAKNDDHLKRTTKKQLDSHSSSLQKGKEKAGVIEQTPYTEFDERVAAERHPGLDERLSNVEAHFSVNYVPSPPLSLLARLKMLEDHIIRLEKEYPPWAALHFNQPNRDWPPPPPSTTLIVPPNVQKIPKPKIVKPSASADLAQYDGKNQSSLHRAVMDRLEVQRLSKGKITG